MNVFPREWWFLLRDRAALLWLALAFMASTMAVLAGLQEIAAQRATIADLTQADRIERDTVTKERSGWGSIAYYSFHLTHDEPSNFAFAALGQRDVSPWKHRIRMLALEGQIYESDTSNPDVALIGRFDFAFVASLLAPLFLILVLHDVRSRERASGQLDLLEATARSGNLWRYRSLLRTGCLWGAVMIPLWVSCIVVSSSILTVIAMSLIVLTHLLFWWMVAYLVTAKGGSSAVNLVGLLGVWLLLAVIAPGAIKAGVNAAIPIPDGADILLTQREAVNDAWDLPREATFAPFVKRHPEFANNTSKIEEGFEWKWYFAFQQVGDQKAEELSQAYRRGRIERDRLSQWLAILSPLVLTERLLQSQAQTDVPAALDYEARVRIYHANLRGWYYSKFFNNEEFNLELLKQRPDFGG